MRPLFLGFSNYAATKPLALSLSKGCPSRALISDEYNVDPLSKARTGLRQAQPKRGRGKGLIT
jgi:hypothetical protein